MSTVTESAAVQSVAKPTDSARFTAKVLREFAADVGEIVVTQEQKRLIQGYFIVIDRTLKNTEDERQRKNAANKDHKYDNALPYTWENVNLNTLALDVVYYARMGLDMMEKNHLFPIPYKNNKAQKYDMNLMLGYNGIQYIALKYALEPPTAVTVELVHETDTFRALKKSSANRVEGYEFEINNAFDRGKVIGGFGYIEYGDPAKNKLIIMSVKDIEKRKPAYASANFWGGEAYEYVDGKKQAVQKAGWYEEMCLKTVKREVYSSKYIPRDPAKVDDSYQRMLAREAQIAQAQAKAEAEANANRIIIDTESVEVKTPAALPEPAQTGSVELDLNTGEVIEKIPVMASAASGASEQQTLAPMF